MEGGKAGERAWRVVFQEGLEEGLEKGIRAMIQDNIEEKVLKERIIAKLQKHFGLTVSEAKRYYRLFAPNE